MLKSLEISSIYVLDQKEALDFYVGKLGLKVKDDIDLGFMRWLTVSVPGDGDRAVLLEKPGQPSMDDKTAAEVRSLLTKGRTGGNLPHGHTAGYLGKPYDPLILNADPKEILFTSGATESNNLAIRGALRARAADGDHVVTAATEHPAVLDLVRDLVEHGVQVTVLPVGTGWLRKAAQSLRLAGRRASVRLEWREIPERRGSVAARALALDLSGLSPGPYRIELVVRGPRGQRASVARDITVRER